MVTHTCYPSVPETKADPGCPVKLLSLNVKQKPTGSYTEESVGTRCTSGMRSSLEVMVCKVQWDREGRCHIRKDSGLDVVTRKEGERAARWTPVHSHGRQSQEKWNPPSAVGSLSIIL